MKKIYSLMVMFVLAAVSMAVSAETYTFEVDDASHMAQFYPYGSAPVAWGTTNTWQAESDEGNATLEAAEGFLISSVKYNNNSLVAESELNRSSVSIDLSDVDDPSIPIKITTIQKVGKYYTFKFTDWTKIGSFSLGKSGVQINSNSQRISTSEKTGFVSVKNNYQVKSITYNDQSIASDQLPGTSSRFSLENVPEEGVIDIVFEEKVMPTYTLKLEGEAEGYDYGYDTKSYGYVYASSFSNKEYTLKTEADGFMLYAKDAYRIESITVNGESVVNNLPNRSATIDLTKIETGSTIVITINKKPAIVYTFTNSNGFKFKQSSASQPVVATEDNMAFTMTNDYDYVEVTSTDAMHPVAKAVATDGTEVNASSNAVQIKPSQFPNSTSFEIFTREVELKSFFISADVPGDVNLKEYFGTYKSIELGEDETEVKYDPAPGNITYTISHKVSGKKLNGVTVNGEPLEAGYGGTYYYTPTDGDHVVVKVKFEDYDVPFRVSFVNEGTEGAIESFKVDGQAVTDWNRDDFTVKLGSIVTIVFKSQGYAYTSLKVNGVQNNNFSSYNTTVTQLVDSKDGYEVELTATKETPLQIAINCPQWEHLNIYLKSTYVDGKNVYSDPVEITGEDFTFEMFKNSTFFIVPEDGYYISANTASEYFSPVLSTSQYVTSAMEFSIELTKIERNNTAVVYVDADIMNSVSFRFNDPINTLSQSFNKSNLVGGYNTISFADNNSLSISGYSDSGYVVYINGEKYEAQEVYPTYFAFQDYQNLADNIVIKFFASDPEIFNVTFEVAEEAAPVVKKDILTDVDLTAESISVENNTRISIASSQKDVELAVKVNNESVSAGDDGIFTFYVTEESTVSISVAKPTSFTVTVDDPAQVSMTLGGEAVELTEGDNVIDFKGDKTYRITGSKGNTLYSVTLNGEALTPEGSVYSYKAKDGDKVVITAIHPEVFAPVKFTFANEGTEDALTSVKVEGVAVENYTAADFTVKVGSRVSMAFNTDKYDISLTLNGEKLETPSFVVEDEKGYTVAIAAVKKSVAAETVVTTVTTDDFANIEIYTGADKTGAVAVEGKNTEVKVEKGSKFFIFAKAGYYISTMTDAAQTKYEVPATSVEVTAAADNTITLSTAQVVRDKNLTVFVEDKAVAAVKLALADADMPGLSAEQTVKAGYNTLKFAANDELKVAAEAGAVEVYVDGEKVDAAEAIGDLTETTVVKIFSETPQAWNMSYKFGEGVEVEVYHDHVTKIESPASHSVFHGTHVAIKPVESQSEAAKAAASKLIVKLNGEALAPNAEGYYEFTADKHVEIAVEKESSGLEFILVDGQDADIYNLQGIKVGNTADSKNLPAGIYIINGVKIRL